MSTPISKNNFSKTARESQVNVNGNTKIIIKITGSVPGRTLAAISLFCSCALLHLFPRISPFCSCALLHTQRAKSLLKKNLLSCYLPSFPYPDSNTCCSSPSFPFLTYIYHPLRPKFSKKENSPISFLLFFSFFKSSNQKQSSQFQIPLQNLPRRVPPSLNSNGKFPCKNMKFLKLNNCMNR